MKLKTMRRALAWRYTPIQRNSEDALFVQVRSDADQTIRFVFAAFRNPSVRRMKRTHSRRAKGPSAIPAEALLGVWKAATVRQQPNTTLTRWRVYEVMLPSEEHRSRHFVGNAVESWNEGRASSEVVSFDAKTRKGVTQSGRVYVLHGPSGWCRDGDHTWNWWLRLNKPTDVVDVTDEVWAAMERASS